MQGSLKAGTYKPQGYGPHEWLACTGSLQNTPAGPDAPTRPSTSGAPISSRASCRHRMPIGLPCPHQHLWPGFSLSTNVQYHRLTSPRPCATPPPRLWAHFAHTTAKGPAVGQATTCTGASRLTRGGGAGHHVVSQHGNDDGTRCVPRPCMSLLSQRSWAPFHSLQKEPSHSCRLMQVCLPGSIRSAQGAHHALHACVGHVPTGGLFGRGSCRQMFVTF